MLAEIMERLSNNISEINFGGENNNIFQDTLPANPDIAIKIEATGGFPKNMWLTDYYEPTIQIIVRGTRDPRVARSIIQKIVDEIGTIGEEKFIATGEWYVIKCQAIQPFGINIGQDDNNRHRFSINFELEIIKEA